MSEAAAPIGRIFPFEYPPGGPLPAAQCCGAQTYDNEANDVNQKSDVVVQANDTNGYPHGWLVLNRTTVIEIPGFSNNNNDTTSYSYANALNYGDVVVGQANLTTVSPQINHALIFIGGKTYDLNSYVTGPGCTQWTLNDATESTTPATLSERLR